MKRIRWNIIFVVFALAISTVLIVGCGQSHNAGAGVGESAPIRIGADSSAFSFQFRVAKAKGLFDKYHVQTDIQDFSYGIDTLNALVLNQVDVGEGMDYATATRLGQGDNLRVISYITTPAQDGGELLVAGDISDPSQLVGHTVACQKGTVQEYIWARTFEKFGIDPKSVNVLYFGSDAEIFSALQSGKVDGVWGDQRFKTKALKVNGFHSLGDYGLIDFVMRGYLVVNNDYYAAHAETVENLLKAIKEAGDYISEHPDETAEIAYDDLKLPKDDVREILKTYQYDVRFSKEDYEHLDKIVSWSIKNGLIKTDYQVKDRINLEPLKKAFPDLTLVDIGK